MLYRLATRYPGRSVCYTFRVLPGKVLRNELGRVVLSWRKDATRTVCRTKSKLWPIVKESWSAIKSLKRFHRGIGLLFNVEPALGVDVRARFSSWLRGLYWNGQRTNRFHFTQPFAIESIIRERNRPRYEHRLDNRGRVARENKSEKKGTRRGWRDGRIKKAEE